MRKLFFNVLLITAFIFILPFKGYPQAEIEEIIELYLGESKIISVSSPKRIAIGNPAIADVATVSKTELTINPKTAGSTNLIVWDNFGEQAYLLKVFTEDTSIIKRRIDNMLLTLNVPGVYTKAADEEDRVLLLGRVKTVRDKDKITAALAQVKDKIIDLIAVKEEEAVIEIDVQVIEFNRGWQDTLGFTWPGSMTLTEVGSPGIQAAGTSWGKVFKVANASRAAFTLKLDALIREGKARILSRPRVSCQSGKEAKLVVGGEVPVLSGTVTAGTSGSGSTGATTNPKVEYKEFGIILNVKPSLEDNGRIHLGVDVAVTELGDQVSTDYALAYKINKRTATTELFLDDDQTMAMGGLIKKKSSEDIRKVPWLSDIPILGALFRQKTKAQGWDSAVSQATDTELFITLTPHIVTQGDIGRAKSAKYAEPFLDKDTEDKTTDPVLRYSKIVQKAILDSFTYPQEAKAAGFEGTVKLSLKLSHQGNLLELKIKEPSAYKVLDDGAFDMALRASPYPPFPSALKENELWVDVPIIYQLN